MLPNPLHPALVHFPIVLAFLVPLAALIALLRIRSGAPPRAAWIWVLLLAAGLFGSALAAVETGKDQEEIVEEVVPRSAIHTHEEGAELFRLLSGLALAVIAVGLLNGRPGQIGRYLGTAAAVGALVVGINVGRSGGELVYEHGAASAYPGTESGLPASRGERERDDDDDR